MARPCCLRGRAAGKGMAADVSPAIMVKLPLALKQMGMSVHRDFDALADAVVQGGVRHRSRIVCPASPADARRAMISIDCRQDDTVQITRESTDVISSRVAPVAN